MFVRLAPSRLLLACLVALPAWLLPVQPARAQNCTPFTDVAAIDPLCANIQWIYNRSITLGCGANLYCPAALVRRDQMAAFMNRLGNVTFQQGGNAFGADAELGTTDAGTAVDIKVAGQRAMRLEPHLISPNVVGGVSDNGVGPGVRGATIAGGGVAPGGDPEFVAVEQPNFVSDVYGTIGGGTANLAGDNAGTVLDRRWATVAGGNYNRAIGFISAVGGGQANVASGDGSAVPGGYNNVADGGVSSIAGGRDNRSGGFTSHVGGGIENVATGTASFVAGGSNNVASGNYSFAAGAGAVADQYGCMVFANWGGIGVGTGSCLGSSYVARFMLPHGLSVDYYQRRPDGGGTRWAYIGDQFFGQTIATWTGAFLSDSGVWSNASDRSAKDGFTDIDPRGVLARLVALPIQRWHYRRDGPGIQHIGPTAQDFRATFGLGDADTSIGTIDADGVALVAIQGLNAKLETEVAEQRRRLADQEREIATLRTALDALVARLDAAEARAEPSPGR